MTMETISFDKYDQYGAYHWKECHRSLAGYKEYNPALDARYEMVVREAAQLPAGGRLLDVGCGDGLLLGRLAPLVKEAVGIDSEAEAIRIATQMLAVHPHCRVLHNACYDVPFGNAEFDLVTSTDVIEHLTDPSLHLSEIRRVLKPGGTLLLTTPKWRPDRKWDERHFQEFKPDELNNLLARHFTKVRMVYFWPSWCSRFYSTKVGWRLLKLAGVAGWNPFSRHSDQPEGFGQFLAVCSNP